MNKLKDQRAVITGGSRGIGKGIAKAFLEEGASVVLLARNPAELEEAAAELGALGKVEMRVADVSDAAAVEEAVKNILAGGQVDILVNAAGVYGPIGKVTENDPAEWKKAIEINLFGTFLMVRKLGGHMRARKSGAIINFVGGGEGAYPHFSSYVSAKGAIARFTETVAAELKEDGIRVNAISPGPVNTKFVDDIIEAGPGKAGQKAHDNALKQKESGGAPVEKAAALAVFLASPTSAGITGRILSAGWTPYEKLPAHLEELDATDVYQVRKILPKDRGLDWEDK